MVGRPRVVVTACDAAKLEALARSARRDEADRTRAIVLSGNGWTSGEVACAFGVAPDSVRRWRTWFMAEGVDGLRATPQAGAAPVKSEAALTLAREVLSGPVADRPNRTLPRLQAELAARSGLLIFKAQLSRALKKGVRWRRPRHCRHGRQDARAVDWSGLRLRLLRQQAVAGDIVLLFGGEYRSVDASVSGARLGQTEC